MNFSFEAWNITELNGYTPVSTFWQDFQIAERFGKSAVADTARRAKAEWQDDVQMFAELVLCLNHRCWRLWEKGDKELSKLYADLYHKYDSFAYKHFKGDDIQYYFNVLD